MIPLFLAKKLIPKKALVWIVVAMGVASLGFFFWKFIGDLNQDKLELALEVQDERAAKQAVSDQLSYKAEESKQKDFIVQIYTDTLSDYYDEMKVITENRENMEIKLNELQLSKNFGKWATENPDRLADCMQSSINGLLDNLTAATRGEVSEIKNNLSCAPKIAGDNHSEALSKADN